MASKGFRSAVARRGAALGLAALLVTAMVGSLVLRAPGPATASGTSGYWVAGIDGGVFNYGQAPFHGSAGAVPLNNPIVGFVPTPIGAGLLDGGRRRRDLRLRRRRLPRLDGRPAAQPADRRPWPPPRPARATGWWPPTAGSSPSATRRSSGRWPARTCPSRSSTSPAPRPAPGYWMTTSDGQVYGFGDAAYFGSVGAVDLNKRIQAHGPDPDRARATGWWAADGGVFAFGDAGNFGAAAGRDREAGRRHRPHRHRPGLLPRHGQRAGLPLRRRHRLRRRRRVRPQQPDHGHGRRPPGRRQRLPAAEPAGARRSTTSPSGDEDAPPTIDVVANDKAPSGRRPPAHLQSVTPPEHGRAQVAGNRVATTPAPTTPAPTPSPTRSTRRQRCHRDRHRPPHRGPEGRQARRRRRRGHHRRRRPPTTIDVAAQRQGPRATG